MARHKAAQKNSGNQAAPKSIVRAQKFPADFLPSELIHLVFTYLKPTEAAAFRWAGRIVAEIGLQYLAPTVYLTLEEGSYDRLLAIAEHPIVSNHVVQLDYETEGLSLINREQFDWAITIPKVIPRRHDSERPNSFASARAWRAFERESIRKTPFLSQKQTTRLLDRAWSIYKEYHASQNNVQRADCFHETLADAMKQFRNLKRISTATDGVYERYLAEIKQFLPTYYLTLGFMYGDPLKVDTTSSVLLAAESAGLHIDSFCCQPFDWQIFTQNDKDRAAMHRGMLYLKIMNIAFTIQRGMGQHRMIREIEFIRRECLDKGRVLDLITSAPDLEFLGLTFETWPQIYPTVNATIGNFHWSSLKAVSLESIATREHDLVDFCKRHAHTLKDLSLRNMLLYEVSWEVIFHRMRRAFRLGQQLHTCKLAGLFSNPGMRDHQMDPMGDEDVNAAGLIVSDYIRANDVGDISLGEYYEARGLR